MWYEELGYLNPVDYFLDPVRFPAAANLRNPALVRVAMSNMMDEYGIPRSTGMRCCRACGTMTPCEITCDQCGSPV